MTERRDLFDNLPSSLTRARTEPTTGRPKVGNPDDVLIVNTASSGAAEIRSIVTNHVGAPRTAEVVAAKLAELYGPFTLENSAENRGKIIENILWIADTQTGIDYDTPRASSSDATTQSPNFTLSTGSGVCRDIHTATSAILASLMNAHQVGGKWVPGSPTGQEANVQTLTFANPTEYHAYMVYRDPSTGKWNALEYGKHYNVQANTSVEAFSTLPGYIAGYSRYRITGWDSKPVIAEMGTAGAAAAREFFGSDAGVGRPGEVRLSGRATGASVTGFVTPNLSVTAAMDKSDAGPSVDGGVKINYHKDFESLDRTGYIRVAGGVYSSSFEASKWTGWRGAEHRAAYRTYVIGLQLDGRMDAKAHELIGEHLMARYGLDANFLAALPLSTGPGADPVIWGGVPDYSVAKLGADGILFGHEDLRKDLSLDWALRARYDLDAIKAAHELITSSGSSAKSLGTDALVTDFAVALTHRAPSVITRFEAGGTQLLATPLDPEISMTGSHRAVLTVSPTSGIVDFGIIAKGGQLNHKLIPVNGIGVALDINPSKNVKIGVGVNSSFPDGNFSNAGKNIEVLGSISVRF
ncbi:MAG: hypothetical protein HYV07_16380 [Deltaproteobacteria bacterium]|nr:hypothetical protein [Deltaproteobacteria bacterium]